MADTAHKEQIGLLLTPAARKMLDALHTIASDEREEADEGPMSLSVYVEWLIRREAKRVGVSPGAKPKRKR